MLNLDLEKTLAASRRDQWSVDDHDWDAPLQGAEHLSAAERRDAGLQLVWTAGLEQQAARVFAMCARFSDDPVARELYTIFHGDELRHAEAELRLAKRFGASWNDLPLATRAGLKLFGANFATADRSFYEIVSANMVMFELALDTVQIPSLQARVKDPLQDEIFRLVNRDESKHLAMDYWLLQRMGERAAGGGEVGRSSLASRARMQAVMLAWTTAFGAMVARSPAMRMHFVAGERVKKYVERLGQIADRSPQSSALPPQVFALEQSRKLVGTLGRLTHFVEGLRARTPFKRAA